MQRVAALQRQLSSAAARQAQVNETQPGDAALCLDYAVMLPCVPFDEPLGQRWAQEVAGSLHSRAMGGRGERGSGGGVGGRGCSCRFRTTRFGRFLANSVPCCRPHVSAAGRHHEQERLAEHTASGLMLPPFPLPLHGDASREAGQFAERADSASDHLPVRISFDFSH